MKHPLRRPLRELGWWLYRRNGGSILRALLEHGNGQAWALWTPDDIIYSAAKAGQGEWSPAKAEVWLENHASPISGRMNEAGADYIESLLEAEAAPLEIAAEDASLSGAMPPPAPELPVKLGE